MSRILAREHVFKILFEIEFNKDEDINELFETYINNLDEHESQNLTESDSEFIKFEVAGCYDNLNNIDEIVGQASKGWKLSRMAKVDLTILRLAVFEMQFNSEIPINVAINEAVNLAKKFSSDHAPAFINGILGQVVSLISKE